MAVDYNAVGATLTDLAFQQKIVGAIEAQIIVVNNESAGTANHTVRLQLLGRAFSDPSGYAQKFAPLISSVAPINGLASVSAATDAQILTALQLVWDAVALRGL